MMNASQKSGGAATSGGGSVEINTSGTISHNGTFSLNGTVFTYTNGTFNSTATLACGANTVALNNWGNISRAFSAFDWSGPVGGQSVTLNSDIYITNNLTFTGNSGGNFNGAGRTVYLYGNISGSGNQLGGTATIQMEGSTNASITIGSITNSLTINKSGIATVSFLSSFSWGTGDRTLQRTAGTINPGNSTITIGTNVNVTVNGMTFWNLTIPGLSTITQNVANTIQNNLTLAATNNVTFTGSAGWTCANLLCSTQTRTITLADSSSGATYRTTTSASMLGAAGANAITMTSNNATTRSLWTLDNGAFQSMVYVNGTRIDSSLGQTVWSFQGTLNNTINWNSGSAPQTVGYTFVC